jgi:chromosomal replication initiation ATPase DnaA
MNFETIGLNICKIKQKNNDNNDKKKNKKKNSDVNIYMADKEQYKQIKHILPTIELTDENEVMQHLPYFNKSGNLRQVLYISGASGSGKSYYTSDYMKEYAKMYPKNPIYIISSLEEDTKLDKNTKRIKLNETFYDTQITINDFKDCLVVYDDTEMIANKLIQEKITNIMNLILTTGRHTNTYLIVTSHDTNAGHKTKLILLESHCITLFLNTMGHRSLKYLLETSFGFNKKQIDIIHNLNSRWVTIFRTAPITVMHENGAFTFNKKQIA